MVGCSGVRERRRPRATSEGEYRGFVVQLTKEGKEKSQLGVAGGNSQNDFFKTKVFVCVLGTVPSDLRETLSSELVHFRKAFPWLSLLMHVYYNTRSFIRK